MNNITHRDIDAIIEWWLSPQGTEIRLKYSDVPWRKLDWREFSDASRFLERREVNSKIQMVLYERVPEPYPEWTIEEQHNWLLIEYLKRKRHGQS